MCVPAHLCDGAAESSSDPVVQGRALKWSHFQQKADSGQTSNSAGSALSVSAESGYIDRNRQEDKTERVVVSHSTETDRHS